jgi:pimeloyl-CoA synthetase
MDELDDEIKEFETREFLLKKKIICSHAAQLAEHFDSVQIICTRFDPQEGTTPYAAGEGNGYARIASTKEWVKRYEK